MFWAGPARPARPPIPHFYRQGPGQPGPQPLTSIGQTPHFYHPNVDQKSAQSWPKVGQRSAQSHPEVGLRSSQSHAKVECTLSTAMPAMASHGVTFLCVGTLNVLGFWYRRVVKLLHNHIAGVTCDTRTRVLKLNIGLALFLGP